MRAPGEKSALLQQIGAPSRLQVCSTCGGGEHSALQVVLGFLQACFGNRLAALNADVLCLRFTRQKAPAAHLFSICTLFIFLLSLIFVLSLYTLQLQQAFVNVSASAELVQAS